jgi:polyferredoxin
LADKQVVRKEPSTGTRPKKGASSPETGRLSGHAGVALRRTYKIRLYTQIGFALVTAFTGWQFARFIAAAQRGDVPLPVRPPGVEGYLPITGLMGLLDWIYQGSLNFVHPAATVMLLTFVAMSLLLRRSFCSWVCPVGLISESMARLGQLILGRNLRAPRWLDIALRGLRYLLLGFFLWAILGMSASALREFIESPYNRVADIKMYLFFAKATMTTIVVLAALMIVSVFVNGAWCRYLCPYGALVGLFALLSPTKVRRDENYCIDCKQCDSVCMARLTVSKGINVGGVECTGCLDCLASCPAPPSLTVRVASRRSGVVRYALAVILLFVLAYGTAQFTGNWRNKISDSEYVRRVAEIDSPEYGHPGGRGYDPQQSESKDEASGR